MSVYDRTGVQGDFSVILAEFLNFISTVAICRIMWKVDAPNRSDSDDGYWIHILQNVFETWKHSNCPSICPSQNHGKAVINLKSRVQPKSKPSVQENV